MARGFALILFLTFAGPAIVILFGGIRLNDDWRTASRQSAGLAPDPLSAPEAVIQAYSARAFNWRGVFGVHTWIAIKDEGAPTYRVFEVIGWRKWSGRPVLATRDMVPDAYWYGNRPELFLDLRGDRAKRLLPKVRDAVEAYPFKTRYALWPGPNSNTFTAFIGREVPELGLQLSPLAIGKDFLTDGFFARSPSGTGFQVSLFGLAGVLLATREGLEFHLLGLTYGIDLLGLAVKLPGLGRIGAS